MEKLAWFDVRKPATTSGTSDGFAFQNPNDLTADRLIQLNPHTVFIPHWSYLDPERNLRTFLSASFSYDRCSIWTRRCPLQNLIVRGFQQTKISAIRVEKGIGYWPCLSEAWFVAWRNGPRDFRAGSRCIMSMIRQIISDNPSAAAPRKERRSPKRRKQVRILPVWVNSWKSMITFGCWLWGLPRHTWSLIQFVGEFTEAKLNADQTLEARVRIVKK